MTSTTAKTCGWGGDPAAGSDFRRRLVSERFPPPPAPPLAAFRRFLGNNDIRENIFKRNL